MSKQAEIDYVARMASVLNVSSARVEGALMGKPHTDPNRWLYFVDLGQLTKLLPPVPARVLDLGVGPGWTSEFLARCGYSVVGVDIAADMIALASRRLSPTLDLRFEVHDYEHSLELEPFDAAVIYDALHHAVDEAGVAANVFKCLKPGGVFITMEPGAGHSQTEETRSAVERFGTTEKDMEYARQAEVMRRAGFGTIRQYLRLNALPLENIQDADGRARQWAHVNAWWEGTVSRGLTSVVVAVKDGGAPATLLPPSPHPSPLPFSPEGGPAPSGGIRARLRAGFARIRSLVADR